MPRFITIIFIILYIQGFSQSKELKGKIIADSLQGYAINIVNFTKQIGTTNDAFGYFTIPSSVGDSIVTFTLMVDESHLEEKSIVSIRLKPIVQQLEQVRVSDVELSGDLTKDSRAIEILPYVDNRTLGLPFSDKPQPTQSERRLYTARSGVIDLPVNYLNGTIKKLKRIDKIEKLKKQIQKGETSFTTQFFVDSLQVPENLISDFIYYCSEDEFFKDLLKEQKKLLLLEFFQNKSKEYRVHKEMD